MIAAYPGSFDPFTKGHLDILMRASSLFDMVYVMVADNHEKDHFFTAEQRQALTEKSLSDVVGISNVEVLTISGTTANFLNEHKVDVVIRGIRNATDLNYEIKLEQYLRATTVTDTVYLTPMTENLNTSSTLVRMFLMTGRLMEAEEYLSQSAFNYLIHILPNTRGVK